MLITVPVSLDDLSREELVLMRAAVADFTKRQQQDIHKRRLRGYKALLAEVRPAFAAAVVRWQRSMNTELRARTWAAAEDVEKVDWEALEEAGRAMMGKVFFDAVSAAGVRLTVHKQRVDPIGQQAVNAARKQCAKMVTRVTTETKSAIRAAVALATDYGLAGGRLQKTIRPLIGLTEPHALAVGRRLTKWLDEGMEEGRAVRTVERYANGLLRWREQTISRTESGNACSTGILSGYEQGGIEAVEWVADPACCAAICEPQDGKVFTLDEAEGLIPAHPNCECTWVMSMERPT